MSQRKYPNVLRAVLETPWAILPSRLAAICEIVAVHLEHGPLSTEEVVQRIGAAPTPRKNARSAGSVAVIPVYGVLVPKADAFSSMSGATPVNRIQAALADAVSSADVSSIVLDIDSPGGQTDLIPELAQQVRDARRSKPVVAVANTLAASAAYWIGSQATEFVASPSAMVGSIGVYAAHEDLSAALEAEGVSTTVIQAGQFKTETGPWGPLSDEARAHIQASVDEFFQMFTGDVAKGRRVPVDQVRGDQFGEGRTFTAKQAQGRAMIDGIEPIESVLDRLTNGGGVKTVPVADPADVAAAVAAAASGDPPAITASAHSGPANAGLSFAATLRQTQERVEEHIQTARGFADVARESRMSAAKREQLAAIADALGAFGPVRSDLVALLEATDPDKPAPDALAAVAEFAAVEAQRRAS